MKTRNLFRSGNATRAMSAAHRRMQRKEPTDANYTPRGIVTIGRVEYQQFMSGKLVKRGRVDQ